jgi:hypothetical protein
VTAAAARGSTPREHVAAAVSRHGAATVVATCVVMLRGDEVDDELVVALVGRGHALWFLEGGAAYWGRVWGARGLLYVFDDTATAALIEAATDPSWRVREMVAKVVAKRRLGDAAGAVAALQGDSVPRVRTAAGRALARLAPDDRAPSSRGAARS